LTQKNKHDILIDVAKKAYELLMYNIKRFFRPFYQLCDKDIYIMFKIDP